MAFQDFDFITERRRQERERKLQKIIATSVILGVLLIFLVCAGVFMVISKSDNNVKSGNAEGKNSKSSQPTSTNKQVTHMEGMIKVMCNKTDYKEKCQKTLQKTASNETAQTKDLLKAGVSAITKEIKSALDRANKIEFEKKEDKLAYEDCKHLISDAIEELEESTNQFSSKDMKQLSEKVPDLNNWLSAVISYQQTCIDGFPEGKIKSDVEKLLEDAKQLTSNSLAMISGLSSFFTSNKASSSSRRLLGLDDDGFPTWMGHEDRRLLKGNENRPTPNVTVAKDGSGNFKTISEALKAMPETYQGRYVIFVKAGIYDETVTIEKKMVNVTMYGDGSQKSIVTGNKNFVDGVRTFLTASFVVLGEGFLGQAMGFRNTAGPEKRQAVAARVQADRSVFLNCRFEGYQDTLYTQTHRQYYRSCVVAGTVDFIFGDAAVIFQNCMLKIRKPMPGQQTAVTAQGRTDHHETTGIIIQNCKIMPDETLESTKTQFKHYLGRPWKEFSRTIIMESTIEDLIEPAGWLAWKGDFALSTLYYAEYNNEGPGAKVDGRVKWPGYKNITKQDAEAFTVEPFLHGDWIKDEGVPVRLGLSS